MNLMLWYCQVTRIIHKEEAEVIKTDKMDVGLTFRSYCQYH